MALNTSTEVEQVDSVVDSNGNDATPARGDLQKVIASHYEHEEAIVARTATVNTAGDPVTVPTLTVKDGKTARVMSHPDNAGPTYVGGEGVSTETGPNIPLQPGEIERFRVYNANVLRVTSETAGDSFIVWTETTEPEEITFDF